MSLCQMIAIVCILAVGLTGLVFFTQVSEAHASKVKHVNYYQSTVCVTHGGEVSRDHIRTAYYILESHAEDPLHSSGACSIHHDVDIQTQDIVYIQMGSCYGSGCTLTT